MSDGYIGDKWVSDRIPGGNGFNVKLESVFGTWFQIMKQYSDEINNEEHMYWFGERATVGSLAAAFARNEITVLEEFVCGREEDRNGRCDLLFVDQHHWYAGEFKQRFPLAHDGSLVFDDKSNGLKCAYKDAAGFLKANADAGDEKYHAFGASFFTPSVRKEENINKVVDDVVERLKTSKGVLDFWAYYAPPEKERLWKGANKRFYPIVALLGQFVKHKTI